MHKHIQTFVFLALATVFFVCFAGTAHSESLVSISGVISEEGQLIGNDGVTYEISDTEKGFELMELAGQQVMVVGNVTTTDEVTILDVVHFEVDRTDQ